MSIQVDVKILDPRIEAIEYATPGAAAVDLRAARIITDIQAVAIVDEKGVALQPGGVMKIGTGIAVHVGSLVDQFGESQVQDDGALSFAALALPRSGLGTNFRIRLANTVGLIDADYQGEVILAVENGGSEPFVIAPMMRLAQLAIVPVVRAAYKVVTDFGANTVRGAGGFGSTGE